MPDRIDADAAVAERIRARLARIARYKERAATTPSITDEDARGAGPANRHGMPQVPVGQHVVRKWPVLDLGISPSVDRDSWRLVVDGAVQESLLLDFKALMKLPQTEDVSDFHCVTEWSKLDMRWAGVKLADMLAVAGLRDEATHLMLHGYDGYTTNLPLEEAVKDDVLVVHTWEGEPLAHQHGGPVRVITPQLYAWKGAKWVSRIEVMTEDRLGFWELRGYSNTAYPWRNDRYS